MPLGSEGQSRNFSSTPELHPRHTLSTAKVHPKLIRSTTQLHLTYTQSTMQVYPRLCRHTSKAQWMYIHSTSEVHPQDSGSTINTQRLTNRGIQSNASSGKAARVRHYKTAAVPQVVATVCWPRSSSVDTVHTYKRTRAANNNGTLSTEDELW